MTVALDPRAEASFLELLRVAARNAEGASALAAAWTELEIAERTRLLEAISEADLAPSTAFHLLAALLAVETDVETAARIADAMKVLARAGGVARSVELRAHASGDEVAGALVLVRGLHGAFVETLALAWGSSEAAVADPPAAAGLECAFDPIVHERDVSALLARWASRAPARQPLASVPPPVALDLLAAAVWAEHRRSGRLPHGLHRFSDLLVPAR